MKRIRINIYAQNKGWLFEDLKNHFRAMEVPGVNLLVTDEPLALEAADIWVCIRTTELGHSPCLERTLACMHDLYDDPVLYQRGGSRHAMREAGGWILCHPQQKEMLKENDIYPPPEILLEQALGALSFFNLRTQLAEVFTLGWVGRNHWRKRPTWIEDLAKQLHQHAYSFRLLLLGRDFEEMHQALLDQGIDCRYGNRADHSIKDYPAWYHQMDALVISSSTEAGPLTLFEALHCGVPVLSTPVGWSPLLAQKAPNYIRLYENPNSLFEQALLLREQRKQLFEQREQIRALVEDWTLENWLKAVVKTAIKLAQNIHIA
ncbi:MAG: glycosyltransferase [Bacteroidota bacterium]